LEPEMGDLSRAGPIVAERLRRENSSGFIPFPCRIELYQQKLAFIPQRLNINLPKAHARKTVFRDQLL
jgi:hypothetical protein